MTATSTVDNTTTKVETTPVEPTVEVKVTTESMPTKAELDEVRRHKEFVTKLESHQQMLEDHGHYHDLGCFYAAGAPIANAAGAELGIVTTDGKTGEVRRSGIGLYLRCDHMGGTPSVRKAKSEC